MRKKRAVASLILGLLFFCTLTNLLAQAPPSVLWYQMRTPHFNILFLDGFNREARRMANTLECLYEPVANSLGVKPRKISIILQNRHALSNGFAELGPRRSEFFTFPTQDYNLLGVNDWLDMLAVHELRHEVQHQRGMTGFSKAIYLLSGEKLLNILLRFAIHPWCWEGDAVGIETALTQGGRGRIPYFSLLYRTNLLERGPFSYTKQIFNSYKHNVSNYYTIGYYLTTYLRSTYGSEILAKVWERVTKYYPFLGPIGFSIALKKETGKGLLQIYADASQALAMRWKQQLTGLPITPVQPVYPRKHQVYTDYLYPQVSSDGSIIVLKSGIGDIATFVTLGKNVKEKKIFIPGDITRPTNLFSTARDKIVWTEWIPDIRWDKQSYSVIKLYDIQTKKLKILTHKSRYNSATLSPDASKIVALESDINYNHHIVLLDAAHGKEIQRIPNPANHFYLTPRWSDQGKHIIAVKMANRKKTITVINVSTGEMQDILPYSEVNIGYAVMHRHYIFYNAAYNEIDNIYAIDLHSGQQFQVTSRKYGAYYPAISEDGQWLFFNDFTKDGMDVVKMPLDPAQWTPLEQVEDRSIRYYEPLVRQEGNSDVLKDIPTNDYPVERYWPWKKLIHIHSWGADINGFSDMGDMTAYQLRFAIQSQNLLSTSIISAGYLHDFHNRGGYKFVSLSYRGCYPIINAAGKIGSTTGLFRHENGELKRNTLQKKELVVGIHLPFTLTNSKYMREVALNMWGALSVHDKGTEYSQAYTMYLSRLLRLSKRDILSKWGQEFYLYYVHTPYGGTYQGQLFAIKNVLYFPGLFKHHALWLRTGYQHGLKEGLSLSSPLLFAQDHEHKDFRNIYNGGIGYTFPIAYPDWSLGLLAKLQRLKAELFYDLTYGSFHYLNQGGQELNKRFEICGIDVTMEVNILTMSLLIDPGVRIIYQPATNEWMAKPRVGLVMR